jgi:hypothetical protein
VFFKDGQITLGAANVPSQNHFVPRAATKFSECRLGSRKIIMNSTSGYQKAA